MPLIERGCARRLPLVLASLAVLGLPDAYAISVTSCTDNGPGDTGNLRNVIASAGNGANIDVTACSQITLKQGEIVISQNDLNLFGPGEANLAINPLLSARTRVFDHLGTGTLWMNGVTVKFGYTNDASPNGPYGGCIRSRGNVSVLRSTVKSCAAVTSKDTSHSNAYVFGGGIYAAGTLALYRSSLSYNTVYGNIAFGAALGGGGYAKGGANIDASTIAGNHTGTISPFVAALYGALSSSGDTRISNSTISGNQAADSGGVGIAGADYLSRSAATVINSTISGNRATRGEGGGLACRYCNLKMYDSTVAFNSMVSSATTGRSAGLAIEKGSLILRNSLLSNNTRGSAGQGDDLSVDAASSLSGSHNLVHATASLVPTGTLSACPLLGPLSNNGGTTRTHALLTHSPALDAGDNLVKDPASGQVPWYDQRGSGYARLSGTMTDIGAIEVEQSQIVFNNGFDGCP